MLHSDAWSSMEIGYKMATAGMASNIREIDMSTPRRTYGTGTLFQRSDGYWIGAIDLPTVNGERRRKTVSSKRKDVAIKRLRRLRKDIDLGRVTATSNV